MQEVVVSVAGKKIFIFIDIHFVYPQKKEKQNFPMQCVAMRAKYVRIENFVTTNEKTYKLPTLNSMTKQFLCRIKSPFLNKYLCWHSLSLHPEKRLMKFSSKFAGHNFF